MKESSDALGQVLSLPGGLVAGATYPLQALILLTKTPKLWICVVIPILLNAVIAAFLSVGLLIPGWQAIDRLTSDLPTKLTLWIAGLPTWAAKLLTWLPASTSWLDEVLGGLLAIVLLGVTGLLLVQFGAILGAPWYGNLAEQIERLRLGQVPIGAPTATRALQDIWRALTFQAKKLLLAIGLSLPLFLLNFLPGVGSVLASVGGVALAATMICLDFLDPPLERRRFSFRTKLKLFGRSLPASGTFSLVCLGLVSVPLLNLITVPLCVMAGTLFCCDRILPFVSSVPPTQPPA